MTMTYPPVDREFFPPEWMKLPSDIQLPSTLRMAHLIEKTALFISKHGSQMEILVKAKQARNPKFDFLLYDSPLNDYYKYLVASMKSGEYVPSLDQHSDSDGSDNEDHYLHPSLLGAKANKSPEKLFLPQLPRVPNENSSYSQLVKSLKDKIVIEPERRACYDQSGNNSEKSSNENQSLNSKNDLDSKDSSTSPIPPPEVQIYIDKLAEYVARKGEGFEATIRKRNEARFDFLNSGHIYHGCYLKKKDQFLEEKKRTENETLQKTGEGTSKNIVSFSFSQKEKKAVVLANENGDDQTNKKSEVFVRSDSDSDLEEQIFSIHNISSKQNNKSHEKQEERRRKAALFLDLIKKKQIADQTVISEHDTTNTTEGPHDPSATSRSPNNSPPTSKLTASPPKERSTSEVVKPSASLLPFKSSDRIKKRDRSSSSSPSSSTCSKSSAHHKPHKHHKHHHPPHRRHHHRHHSPSPHRRRHRHPPSPPHHRRHHRPHHHGHHHRPHCHHRHRHHSPRHRKRRSSSRLHSPRSRSKSRSRSSSISRSRSRTRSESKSRSGSRSRSSSRSSSRSISPRNS